MLPNASFHQRIFVNFLGYLQKIENMASSHASKAYLNDLQSLIILTPTSTTLILSSPFGLSEIHPYKRFVEVDQNIGKSDLSRGKGLNYI